MAHQNDYKNDYKNDFVMWKFSENINPAATTVTTQDEMDHYVQDFYAQHLKYRKTQTADFSVRLGRPYERPDEYDKDHTLMFLKSLVKIVESQ